MPEEREFLLADADVLIDYVASDLAILALASEHIGRVHVLEQTLTTVVNLSERECQKQGIEVISDAPRALTLVARGVDLWCRM